MGLSFSSDSAIFEQEKAIETEIEEWLQLRSKTISELSRVAESLESLHWKVAYSKLAGGIAGFVGGGLALGGLALSLITGGTSLFLTGTGLALATGGGVTATLAEVVESVKKQTGIDEAQKTLEEDKRVQAALLAKIENTIDTSKLDLVMKKRYKTNFTNIVQGIQNLWISGIKVYSWAKSGQAIYHTVKWAKTGGALWKYGATQGLKRTLMSFGGGVAGSIFMMVDLGYVIHHAIQIKRGTPSDAAKYIRDVIVILKVERDRIIASTRVH